MRRRTSALTYAKVAAGRWHRELGDITRETNVLVNTIEKGKIKQWQPMTPAELDELQG